MSVLSHVYFFWGSCFVFFLVVTVFIRLGLGGAVYDLSSLKFNIQ